jgi:hypothetical protein
MPTLYGALSYSLRQVDARTLRFDIATKMTAPLILRPPMDAPLRSVVVNGTAIAPTGDSIAVANTPAEVICVLT